MAIGTTSLSIPYPASIAAGDLLVVFISNKYPANGPTTPAGFTRPTNGQGQGGAGASGIDTGQVFSTCLVKEADGTETGNLAVTITSGNSAVGRMWRCTKSALKNWEYVATNGADNAGAGNWSVTGAADPGVTAADLVLVGSAINADTYTYTLQAITSTGVTYAAMTEQQDSGTAGGQDCYLVVSSHPVTSGTSSAAPVYTMTTSGSAVSAPAGASVFLRLREVDPPAGGDSFDPMGMLGFFGL